VAMSLTNLRLAGNYGQVGVYYWTAAHNKHENLVRLAILGIASLECSLLEPESGQSASRPWGVQADVSNAYMDKH